MFSRGLCPIFLFFPIALAAQQPCGAPGSFLPNAKQFALAALALAPVEAGQAGYHVHEGKSLDAELDDLSPASIAAQHTLLVGAKECFSRYGKLSAEDAADLASLQNTIDEQLFDLDHLQGYHYHPQEVAEMIGSGLFFPLTATNGTEQQRMENVLARMAQVPKVLDEERANLREADPVFIDAAVEETQGDIDLLTQIGEMIPAGSPLRPRYDAAVKPAHDALAAYVTFLKDDLAKRPHTRTWRSGPEDYARIFAFALGPGATDTPASVLAGAQQDLVRIRTEMYTLALPLHKQEYPEHTHADLEGAALENKIIAEVIDRINDDHTTPGHLLDRVRSEAGTIRGFIAAKNLLTLSSNDNMKIVPTPAFLRGVYSVAGFHSAPPLEPSAEAEYWVTPIDPSTPAKQADSKLREYNNWMLQYLTMHEALPGHYTQFEHANAIVPPERRLLRALFGNGAYVEGWGEYGVKEMEDAGYANHDPRFVLMVLKIRLRVVTNAILDIRMQSMNMTDEEAMALMEGQAFQTHAEATGKLRRAKLTAGQLITYYVGFHQWIDLRAACEKSAGASFSLKRFNDAALDEGPLPIPLLKPLLLAGPACRPTLQSSPAPGGSRSSQ
jgi:uncharacterized protein (DUF885 family)